MINRASTSPLFAFLLALALAPGLSATAFADEGTVADDNVVDPTQRADNSFIYDTTIEDVLGETALHDGRIVQFVGEAIGDRVLDDASGHYCWVAVESMAEGSDASISVYMTVEQAAQIDHYGRYGVTGTTLQVRGKFNQACSEHEGLVDIHADNVAVIAKGVEHPDTLNLSNFGFAALLVLIGGVLIGVFYFARERMR